MADNVPQASEEEQKAKPKIPLKTILLIVGVMVMEGGTIIGFKVAHEGKMKPSQATDPISQTETRQESNLGELLLCENVTVDNYVSGRARTIITVGVGVRVDKQQQEKVAKLAESNSILIKDRIVSLIGAAKPDELRDPDHQVLRRKVKAQLDEIIGPGQIHEVLISDWQSFVQD